jgi:hypothetical protein
MANHAINSPAFIRCQISEIYRIKDVLINVKKIIYIKETDNGCEIFLEKDYISVLNSFQDIHNKLIQNIY